jgi:cellulose biosynthesis protein BcsQ
MKKIRSWIQWNVTPSETLVVLFAVLFCFYCFNIPNETQTKNRDVLLGITFILAVAIYEWFHERLNDLYYDWKRGRIISYPPRTSEDELPLPKPDPNWKQIDGIAKVYAVVSGKGGVGKTTIALGMMEELSRGMGGVLLVDFDLHNRGLTSKLRSNRYVKCSHAEEAQDTVFQLAIRFHEIVKKMEFFPEKLSELKVEKLVEIIRAFCYEDFIINKLHELGERPLIGVEQNIDGIRLPSCSILRSRTIANRFIASAPFRFSEIQTAIFIRCLAALAKHKGYEHVVLDCHGAHDLATIGAAWSADQIFVVSTADESSWEGTAELVDYLRSVKDANAFPLNQMTLILNEVPSSSAKLRAIVKDRFEFEDDDIHELKFSMPLRRMAAVYNPPWIQKNSAFGLFISRILRPRHRDGIPQTQNGRIDDGDSITTPNDERK